MSRMHSNIGLKMPTKKRKCDFFFFNEQVFWPTRLFKHMKNLGTEAEVGTPNLWGKGTGRGKPQCTVPRAQHSTALSAAVKLGGPWMGTLSENDHPMPHPQPSMSITALILDLKHSPVEEPIGNTKTPVFSSIQRRLKMGLSFPPIFFRLKCDFC